MRAEEGGRLFEVDVTLYHNRRMYVEELCLNSVLIGLLDAGRRL